MFKSIGTMRGPNYMKFKRASSLDEKEIDPHNIPASVGRERDFWQTAIHHLGLRVKRGCGMTAGWHWDDNVPNDSKSAFLKDFWRNQNTLYISIHCTWNREDSIRIPTRGQHKLTCLCIWCTQTFINILYLALSVQVNMQSNLYLYSRWT